MNAKAVEILKSPVAATRESVIRKTQIVFFPERISPPPILDPSRSRLGHRLGREKVFVDRSHVDVPTFALRSFEGGPVAHRGLSRLNVSRDRAHYERSFEGIDCDPRVRHRTVAIGQKVYVAAVQLTAPIVGIDVRRVEHFRVRVYDRLRVQRRTNLSSFPARGDFEHVQMPHLPRLRASTRAVVRWAPYFGCMLSMHHTQHFIFP